MCDMLTKSFLFNVICTIAIVIFSRYVEAFRPRVRYGADAELSDFNYHVSIQMDGEHLCGGAILTDQFVLTAAHCFIENGTMTAWDRQLTVRSGTNLLSGFGFVNEIEYVMVLLDFVDTYSYYYKNVKDIAVVKIKSKFILDGHYSQKISLPEEYQSSPPEGETVRIAGYGLTEEANIYYDGNNEAQVNGSVSKVLKTIETRIMDIAECQLHVVKIDEKHICTYKPRNDDDENRYGECYGDSGSPLEYNNKVVGVVSSGPPLCGERDTPTIYTRVSYYLDFIRNAMNLLPNIEMVIYKKSKEDGHYYWS